MSSEPPIDSAMLLAYLDGAVSADVAARIEASPELLAQAQELARQEARVRLFWGAVPDEPDLDLAPPSLPERARVILARLHKAIDDTRSPPTGAALAPAWQWRDDDDSDPSMLAGAETAPGEDSTLVFLSPEIQVILRVAAAAALAGVVTLQGLVTGLDATGGDVFLVREGTVAGETSLTDQDTFTFTDVPPGRYTITLATETLAVQLEPFEI